VLLPVAQHQTRFSHPGLGFDERGVVVGERSIIFLPSLDRVIAVLQILSESVRSDELFSSMEIQRVRGSLGSHDFVVTTLLRDSRQLDRVAEIASLHRGELLVGSGRNYVRYRDRRSPLGYDADRLAEGEGDFLLQGRVAEGGFSTEDLMPLRALLMRVGAKPGRSFATGGEERAEILDQVFVLARTGLRKSLEAFIWRRHTKAEICELSEGLERRHYLYRVETPPPELLRLCERTPGLTAYIPDGSYSAVEYGFIHSFNLGACASVLAPHGLHLFSGGGAPVRVLRDAGAFIPLCLSVGLDAGADRQAHPKVLETVLEKSVDRSKIVLRLVPSLNTRRDAGALYIPKAQRSSFEAILYLLPPSQLERCQVADFAEGLILLPLDPGPRSRIQGIPLGTPLWQAAPEVYLPVGLELVPRIKMDLLVELFSASASRRIFFLGVNEPPIALLGAFSALDREFLAIPTIKSLAARSVPALAVPQLRYPKIGPFPLWGSQLKSTPGEK